jgi:hypothetical protein
MRVEVIRQHDQLGIMEPGCVHGITEAHCSEGYTDTKSDPMYTADEEIAGCGDYWCKSDGSTTHFVPLTDEELAKIFAQVEYPYIEV